MLRGSQTISYYSPSNIAIWMAMALQAGVVDIGGLLACHSFVSHITGAASNFALGAQQGRSWESLLWLLVPLFFMLGAMLSGVLVDSRLLANRSPRYFVAFGIMSVFFLLVSLLGISGWFGAFGAAVSFRKYILLLVLCLICGLQNGTITSVSKSVVRTTHLTGITTDLGLGIVRSWYQRNNADRPKPELRANLMRGGIIANFIFGAMVGAWIFHRFGYAGFFLPTAISAGLFAAMIKGAS